MNLAVSIKKYFRINLETSIVLAASLLVGIVYYLLATKGTFIIPYSLDYFNPLAKSFLIGRYDIVNPVLTYDLSNFHGRWYPYWGPLPAFFLTIPLLILHRYIPSLYLSLFSILASIPFLWAIMKRINRDYLDRKNPIGLSISTMTFLLFGSSLLFVGTKPGVWFVSQAVSFLPQLIALSILLKIKLKVKDYFLSSFFISLALLGRYTLILTGVLLLLRLIDDFLFNRESLAIITRKIIAAAIPFLLFFMLFSLYNWARFSNPFDTGYAYHDLTHFDVNKVLPYGIMSWKYIPRNLFLIFLEIPHVTFNGIIPTFKINPEAMSIFFVSPFLLFSLLTLKQLFSFKKDFRNRMMKYLWITWILLLFPTLLLFSPGVRQFGVRYSVDFVVILTVLALIGLNNKKVFLFIVLGTIAIAFNIFGIFIL